MLAITTMSPDAQAVLYAVALVCFAVVVARDAIVGRALSALALVALGFVFLTVIALWNAIAA